MTYRQTATLKTRKSLASLTQIPQVVRSTEFGATIEKVRETEVPSKEHPLYPAVQSRLYMS